MGLDYDYPERDKACSKVPLKVKLDGKHVGEIRKVNNGFQYYPTGQKKGGEVFERVSDVQRSLLKIQPKKTGKQKSVETDDVDDLKNITAKQLKKINRLEVYAERSKILLSATVDLLGLQGESKEVLNLLEQTVTYDDTECDGHSLEEDINNHLDS